LLPALDGHIDVGRVQFDAKAHPAGGFRRDQRGAGSHEGFKHRLTGAGIVQDRAAHAFDRLLRTMHGDSILAQPVDRPRLDLAWREDKVHGKGL
jgi:hypothetical protein